MMKPVKDLISGCQYESMRLASQTCNITIRDIKKSLFSKKAYKASNGKKYIFRDVLYGNKTTHNGTVFTKMPFGKYKGEKIAECKDLLYLKWFVKLKTIHPRLRVPIINRIKKLNSDV